MTFVSAKYDNEKKPVIVKGSRKQILNTLSNVDKVANGCHPTTKNVSKISDNEYLWEYEPRKIGTTYYKATHVAKYQQEGDKLSWTTPEDERNNMSSKGNWTVKEQDDNTCALTVDVEMVVDLPMRKRLATFINKIVKRELKRVWSAYSKSIKKAVENGVFEKEDVGLDAPVHSDEFEKARFEEGSRTDKYDSCVKDYFSAVTEIYREYWGDQWHFGLFDPKDEDMDLDQAKENIERIVAQSASMDENSRVLDVGCGVGGPTCYMAKITGARITGVNLDGRQLEIARKKAEEMGVSDHVDFIEMDAMKIDFPDNTFDVITFFESPCMFPDKDEFFQNCIRMLKPGGRLSGTDWIQCHNPTDDEVVKYIEPICAHFACPRMYSLYDYQTKLQKMGLFVTTTSDLDVEGDLRSNWSLLEDIMETNSKVLPQGQEEANSSHEMLISGGIVIATGAIHGAFTIGRILAVKPPNADRARHWNVGGYTQ
eukprot:gb/GECH01011260.1/.p1 GENE.gb/GECH01011260.1/~~gb/GECH01011260.1/.p1  ORF type:complete len:483 (+),score=130.38 gb/GECH01011260.1/:1-1449(+)